ncbi:hypothetical protein IV203_001171 [Nitzschia inconspicua]|uniref:Uncharacterized protein n=1 Tax=Nitzschia inconspicua TaxID=303405 RepID=A0A9K3PQQ4_9STRA|nr:hypothetical protein IV203_001171 [Nitzschia inconspicua]
MLSDQNSSKQDRNHAEIKSIGSPDITYSLSSPRSPGEVSWSSSEGSSYDTAKDLANIRFGTKETTVMESKAQNPKVSNHRHGIDPPFLPMTNTQNTPTKISSTDIAQAPVCSNTKQPTESSAKPPKSRLMRPFIRTNPDVRPTLDDLILKHPHLARNFILDNVEVYSAVNLASGTEDMSAVGFLTKEDTNQVFYRRVIPIEIATNESFGEISAVSTSVAGSTETVSGEELDGLSLKAVHRMHPTQSRQHDSRPMSLHKVERPQPMETSRQTCPRVCLTEADDAFLLKEISQSCQRTVSSLESSLTWDSQQEENDSEGNGSEDAVRGPNKPKQHTDGPPKDTFGIFQKAVLSLTADPGVDLGARNMERPDATMDERIKQLKEKIKNMQQASDLETGCGLNFTTSGTAPDPLTRADSISLESTVSGLPSEAVTTLAATEVITESARAQQSQIPKSKIHSRTPNTSRHSSQKTNTRSIHSSKYRSTDGNIPVPSVISTRDDFEEVSLMDCNNRRHFVSTGDSSIDIESGERSEKYATFSEMVSRYSRVSEATQNYAVQIIERIKALVALLVAYAQTQKQKFKTKSRNEQVVTVFIGASLFIFFILLIVFIS